MSKYLFDLQLYKNASLIPPSTEREKFKGKDRNYIIRVMPGEAWWFVSKKEILKYYPDLWKKMIKK